MPDNTEAYRKLCSEHIATIKNTIKYSNLVSICLFAAALVIIVLFLFIQLTNVEYLKWGFSSLSAVAGFGLQGFCYPRKMRLTTLLFLYTKQGDYSTDEIKLILTPM